ncbi:hypothetical protein D0C36_10720 [Mucilaginibacter conchicola]|uniref:TonB-dependent receptor plug domain-containing protein n=1 Tax=Mucilaginibacter conchicola TaxID=2303333 RepID=A0A372NSG4_9SPHI|nr:TonB-dependent receptor plug domain-containing protein [Mucilaginibacter conchicola]RFZ91914.1 hypothetical protein D0C36_10720 [Mucilaginibacter conchicola]
MRRILLCVLSLTGFALPLSAQVTQPGVTADNFVQNLKTAVANVVVEKAYLHFDRACYTAGDTIYFKAYVTSGEKHEPTKVSGVLHADLISDRDSVIQSLLLQINNGTASGDFALAGYLHKGNYRVRAYTQWMRNYGDKSFFNRIIPINGNTVTASAAVTKTAGKPDVQFFAEAGTFVTGIPARIAFKAIGNNGLGTDVQGVVVDNTGATVTKFKSAHLGMGHFYLTAAAGKTYSAKLTFADGSTSTIELPKPESKGIAMMVNNADPAKFSVDINTTKAYYLENKNKNITIIIAAQSVVKTVKTVLDNQVIGFDMPVKDLPSGVVNIVLFGPDGNAVGERMLFVQGNDILNSTLSSDKQAYNSADKTALNLTVKQPDGSPAKGSFSVSVVNEGADVCKDMAADNILSYVLLTSDIRGYIEQPGYYFDNVNADTRNNLDILMLTQGYRGLVKLAEEKPVATTYKPEGNLQLKGRLTTKAGKPLVNEKISVLTDASQSAIATTDNEGKFAFNNVSFNNGSKFILNVENKSSRKNATITIEKTNAAVPVIADKATSADAIFPAYVQSANMVMNNLNAIKGAKKTTGAAYHTTSLLGPGKADQVIFRKDIPNSTNLSLGLQNIVRGVDFLNGQPFLRMSNAVANGSVVKEPMMVVIDGTLLTGGGSIDNVLIQDVDNVEVLKGANALIYGMGSGAGVMIINTKQGGVDSEPVSNEMAPGIVSVIPQGYYIAHTFYNPVYSPVLPKNIFSRPTVFWKADVNTDDTGMATFSFNNTAPGVYRVLFEGIDTGGHLGRAMYRYTVK